MSQYGVPYMGSKNKIAEKLFRHVPTAENFYDLFCGGCAMSHRAIVEGRFKHVYANDLDGRGLHLFIDAAAGKYRDERRWISREEFFRLKDSDPYVNLCWSFGNNGRDYLYARDIEPYKRAAHYVIMLNDWQPMRELLPAFADWAEPQMGGGEPKTRRFFCTLVRRLAQLARSDWGAIA